MHMRKRKNICSPKKRITKMIDEFFENEFTIECLKKVDSTNTYIEKKYLKKRKPAVVRADMQTGGMGTKGRSFISAPGGLYFSRLVFYDFLPVERSFEIMTGYAVAVVKTLHAFDIDAKIKWPNDILVNGKKICGILIKNGFRGDFVDYSLTGVGINVNNPIAPEISDIAISMQEVAGKTFDIDSVFFTFLKNAGERVSIDEYKSYSAVQGRRVQVVRGDETFEAMVADISDDGRLVLENGEKLSAAELDLKIRL